MSILSDADILDYIETGKLKIENFNEDNLTPNGYDTTIEEILYEDNIIRDGTVEIESLKWFAVSTREYFKMGEDLAAQIWLRTSWARKGIQSTFGKIDAGFEGTLTFSAFNASSKPVEMKIGERFAQVVFEKLTSSPLKTYDKRSAHYAGQRGVTLEPRDRKHNEP
jgi:dCTP deaminase